MKVPLKSVELSIENDPANKLDEDLIELLRNPEDFGSWIVSSDGRYIASDDFRHDVTLQVTGDFLNDKHRKAYSELLAQKLNRRSWK